MLLAEECTKYVEDDQGILNLKLMQELYHVVAYNLAKSRAARDVNKTLKRKNFRPRELKQNGLVRVRDYTSGAFEPKAIDHHIVDFYENRVLVKDNNGNTKKVHRKDIQPVEMDIAMAEFFRREREKSTIRDAKHVMPIKQIPDLNWKFDKKINQAEAVEPEEGQQGEHSSCSPKTSGSTLNSCSTKVEETAETAPEATCPMEISQTEEGQQGKHLPCSPKPTGSTPDNQAGAVEQTEAIELAEAVEPVETAPESICPTEISQIEEGKQEKHSPFKPKPPRSTPTCSSEKEDPVTSTEKETEVTPITEQATQTTPKSPQVSDSLVTKLFFVFRPVTDEASQPTPDYGLQLSQAPQTFV